MNKSLLLIMGLISFTLAKAQNVGINQSNPTNSLHISPINLGDSPLRIDNLQAFTIGDTSILVVNPTSGIVKYMNASELSNSILNTTLINNISDSLIANSTFINNFGDSLFLSQNFIDSLTNHLYNNGDTLLYNSSFINSLRDSIDTDVDSIVLNGTLLTIYENGSPNSVNLSSLSDNDGDPTNEHNTNITLTGNTLNIIDAGGTKSIDLTPIINNAVSNAVPAGTVTAYAGASPPSGYLVCDGSPISRTTYPNLFTAIGTMYGNGDGTTTFNLPDYRGQFLRGYDNSSGKDIDANVRTDRGDGTTGDAVGTKQTNQTLAHNHTIDPPATNSNSTGDHLHTIDPPSTASNSTGSHAHSVDPPNTSTSTNGNHSHTYLRPQLRGDVDRGGGSSSWSLDNTQNGTTSTTGNHNHTINIAAFNSASSGNHSHTTDIAQFNSNTTGTHIHSTDITQFNSGNNGGSETRPTNISVLWCIKF